jgi:hypothetical protein
MRIRNIGIISALLGGMVLFSPEASAQYASPLASTRGGAVPFHFVSTASTNATNFKNTFGTVYTIHAFSADATSAYLHIYDKATTPVCGTDVPVQTYSLQQNVPRSISFPVGLSFTRGIGFCITGAISDTDATAAVAGVELNISYK